MRFQTEVHFESADMDGKCVQNVSSLINNQTFVVVVSVYILEYFPPSQRETRDNYRCYPLISLMVLEMCQYSVFTIYSGETL